MPARPKKYDSISRLLPPEASPPALERLDLVVTSLVSYLDIGFCSTDEAPRDDRTYLRAGVVDYLEDHPDAFADIKEWCLREGRYLELERLLSDALIWTLNDHCRDEMEYKWLTPRARFAYEYSVGPRPEDSDL